MNIPFTRRRFMQGTTLAAGSMLIQPHTLRAAEADSELWFDKPMRWAQMAFVENDPGQYDKDFWLDFIKRTQSQAAVLSAGGVVAFYPTKIPLHYRSAWLGDTDPFGDMARGCREMGMVVVARTDPHAVRQDVFDAHPDWIMRNAQNEPRRHWANRELWVTCPFGPYNFEFMTEVHKEIVSLYQVEGIFSNRWKGHGKCFCEHCKRLFKEYSGQELPETNDARDPVQKKYIVWSEERLVELWKLWDKEIRAIKADARFIPNGPPNMKSAVERADLLIADHQARSGNIPPWSNGRTAKRAHAVMGNKPYIGIFSVGLEESYRWKDSVQSEPEIRLWAMEGTASGMRPWFIKFSATLYDKRWLKTVENIHQWHAKAEPYLRNTASLANVAMVYSEQTEKYYRGDDAQKNPGDFEKGMYHALVEARIPFDMAHEDLLDADRLRQYRLLILPNVAALSDRQCEQLVDYVSNGGSLLATYETSLYNEWGEKRDNFGLSDLLAVKYKGRIEGRMQNSYLSINPDAKGDYHPILQGLDDTPRIINGAYRVEVEPLTDFPFPITLIPTYPDLPMEHVFPRIKHTDTREIYLRELGESRIVYVPWDIDRIFWEILAVDHGRLLSNLARWALHDDVPVTVQGSGLVDVNAWRQKDSVTVHLVNLTNPMMMRGPIREFIPIGEQTVEARLPQGAKVRGVKLLVSEKQIDYQVEEGTIQVVVPSILDHEVVAIDLV